VLCAVALLVDEAQRRASEMNALQHLEDGRLAARTPLDVLVQVLASPLSSFLAFILVMMSLALMVCVHGRPQLSTSPAVVSSSGSPGVQLHRPYHRVMCS
jgi:hypothetical protein